MSFELVNLTLDKIGQGFVKINQTLTYLSNTKADVNHNHDVRYYTQTQIANLLDSKADDSELALKASTSSVNAALATKSNTDHNHDTRYYTESEMNTFLDNKADASDVTALQTQVDNKANSIHSHPELALPIGAVQMWAGATDPAGGKWMIMNGRALNRTTYATLFNLLGGSSSPYGLPTTDTFNLPNMRGRTAIGAGWGGAGFTSRSLGATGGAETHLLTGQESGIQSHSHVISNAGGHASADGSNRTVASTAQGNTQAVADTNAVQAHNNMQPFLALNYIIKVL